MMSRATLAFDFSCAGALASRRLFGGGSWAARGRLAGGSASAWPLVAPSLVTCCLLTALCPIANCPLTSIESRSSLGLPVTNMESTPPLTAGPPKVSKDLQVKESQLIKHIPFTDMAVSSPWPHAYSLSSRELIASDLGYVQRQTTVQSDPGRRRQAAYYYLCSLPGCRRLVLQAANCRAWQQPVQWGVLVSDSLSTRQLTAS